MARHSQEEWIKNLEDQKTSGMTQTAYCQEHNLSLASFRYWKKRKVEGTHSVALPLVEVPMRLGETYSGWLKVAFPNGCTLQVPFSLQINAVIELAKAMYHL